MKDQLSVAGLGRPEKSLRRIVANLVDNSLPVAAQNNTIIVNAVRQGIILGAENPKAFVILNDLLNTIVFNSRKGEIHITAERSGHIIILQMEERNNYNGYALSFSLVSIEPDAMSIGGHLLVKDPCKKVITVQFAFPNLAA